MGEGAEAVHLQLEDEIIMIECGRQEPGAGGSERRNRQSVVSVFRVTVAVVPIARDL